MNLSATLIAKLLGKNPYISPFETVYEIITKTRFPVVNPRYHGIITETEAIGIYKLITNSNITLKKKILKHPKYQFITGQIDAISNNDTIVEIKCPTTKIFPTTNESWTIPDMYWVQIQLYMQILNFEKAHYCEYYKQDKEIMFRYKIVTKDQKWFEDIIPKLESIREDIEKYNQDGIHTHPEFREPKKRKID